MKSKLILLPSLVAVVVMIAIDLVHGNSSPMAAYAYYPTYQANYPQHYQNLLQATPAGGVLGNNNAAISSSSSARPYYALYHQNVYPGPFYTYQTMSPASSNAEVYSRVNASPGGSSSMMLTSASEVAAITHTERPSTVIANTEATFGGPEGKLIETSKGKTSSSAVPGIVFGRPLGGYDGYYYVPVYYPSSWLSHHQQQHQQQQAVATSAMPTYAYQQTFYPSQSMFSSTSGSGPSYYPSATTSAFSNDFYESPSPAYHYRVYAPPAGSYRSSLVSASGGGSSGSNSGSKLATTHEMMPSDVTPDINGNYKRSSKEAASNRRGGSKVINTDLSGFTRYADYLENGLESSNVPIYKYRDPKAEASLALEALRHRAEAQKQFEKEVLLLDENGNDYDLDQENIAGGHSGEGFVLLEPNNNIKLTNSFPKSSPTASKSPMLASGPKKPTLGKMTKNLHVSSGYRIESRSDPRSTERPTVSSKKAEPSSENVKSPLVTSIEIFDAPGANQLLGLMKPTGGMKSELKSINATLPSLESLYHQLAHLGF